MFVISDTLFWTVSHFTNYSGQQGDLFRTGGLTQKVGEYGILGVFVFFIITGFVIPLSLIKYNFRLSQLHKFLSKRWIRIEIPYLISIALVLSVYFIFSIKNNTPFDFDLIRLFHHLFYTTSFFNYEWYNPIYWTLAIEMQFYILIALMYPLLKFENQILNCLMPLALGFSALIFEDHRLVFHYGPIFSQGILLLLTLKNKIGKYTGILCITLCSIITTYTNGIEIAIISITTIGIIAFYSIDKKIFNWIGNISYSLYLIHGLIGGNIIYFFGRYTNDYLSKATIAVVALISSIFMSFVFWRIIERPSKKWSKKITLSNIT